MSRTSAAREPARVVTGDPAAILPPFFRSGEVAEWLKAHAWKACIRETVSWVRIPPSPPVKLRLFGNFRSSALYPYCKTHNLSAASRRPGRSTNWSGCFVVPLRAVARGGGELVVMAARRQLIQ